MDATDLDTHARIHKPLNPEVAPRARSSSILFFLVAAAALALLVWQAHHFWPFIADDAFISMRYSQRLLEGKGLTWSTNERVEGYTNLLWVLLCAGLGKLGMDLLHAARLLGILPTLFAFASLVAYVRISFAPERRALAAACSLIPFALSAPVAVWMIGGLEEALLTGLLGCALVAIALFIKTDKQSWLHWASLFLAGVTLTRADGLLYPLLFVAILSATQYLAHRRIGRMLLLLVGPIAAYLGQLAFRLAYYHQWLPNTAYVKVSFTVHRLVTGLAYIRNGAIVEFSLILLALIGCTQLWRDPRGRVFAALYLPTVFGICCYLVLVGGDIFPALRHLVPVILILCFAAAHASLLAYDARGALQLGKAAGLVCLALLVIVSRVQARKALTEHWELANREVGLYIDRNFAPDILLVSDAAGALPFYAHRDTIDPLGLNNFHIAHEASVDRGKGLLGHELGDGKYVLDHKPDIIIFGPHGRIQLDLPSDLEITQDPRFKQDYVLQHWTFNRPEPFTTDVYVRRSLSSKNP